MGRWLRGDMGLFLDVTSTIVFGIPSFQPESAMRYSIYAELNLAHLFTYLRLPRLRLRMCLLTPLQRRKIHHRTPRDRSLRMRHRPGPRTPPQRPNPRLHIPADSQRDTWSLRHFPRDVPDLILWALIAQTQDAGSFILILALSLIPIRAGIPVCARVLLRKTALRLRRCRRGGEIAVSQGGEGIRRFGGWDDGVPEDGFGGTHAGGGVFGGWICREDVDEELFCVPVEEGGEVFLTLAYTHISERAREVPASKSNRTCAYSSLRLE